MKNWKDYFLEGILIIFSVLFALFINNYSETLKTQRQKELALNRISKELEKNSKILAEWIPHHEKIYRRLYKSSSEKNYSLKNVLMQYDYFSFDVLSDNQRLFHALPSHTTWETAKATGMITEFDFELVEELTKTYALQDLVVNHTLQDVTQILLNQNTHDMKKLDANLRQLEIRFSELTGQERNLEKNYYSALVKLK
jgi:hypothetical protein